MRRTRRLHPQCVAEAALAVGELGARSAAGGRARAPSRSARAAPRRRRRRSVRGRRAAGRRPDGGGGGARARGRLAGGPPQAPLAPSRPRRASRSPSPTARRPSTRRGERRACTLNAAAAAARRRSGAEPALGRVSLCDGEAVPQGVVQRVGRGRAARRRGHAVVDDARRDDQDPQPGAPGAQRPVDVLGVREERLVERADLLERGTGNQHRAAAGPLGLVRRGRAARAAGRRTRCAVPGGRAGGRSSPPRTRCDRWRCRGSARRRHRRPRAHASASTSGSRKPGSTVASLFSRRTASAAVAERGVGARVDPTGEAAVLAEREQADSGELRRHGLRPAVGRAVVDDDDRQLGIRRALRATEGRRACPRARSSRGPRQRPARRHASSRR